MEKFITWQNHSIRTHPGCMPNQTTLFNYRWIIIPLNFLQMTSACLGPVAEGRYWVKALIQHSQLYVVALPVWGGGGIWPVLEVEAGVKQKTLVWLSVLLARQLGLSVQEGHAVCLSAEAFVWATVWFVPLPRTEDGPSRKSKVAVKLESLLKVYCSRESDAFVPARGVGYTVNQAFPVLSRSWGHLDEGLAASCYR